MSDASTIRHWNPDLKTHKAAYDSSDEIGKILRVHFELEQHLKSVLGEIAPTVDLSKVQNFAQQCQILRAMQISLTLVELLECFNSLRNALAHRREANLKNNGSMVRRILELGNHLYSKMDSGTVTFVDKETGQEVSLKVSEMSLENKLVRVGHMATAILAVIPQAKKFSPPTTVMNLPNVTW